jgi:hypothetical protein
MTGDLGGQSLGVAPPRSHPGTMAAEEGDRGSGAWPLACGLSWRSPSAPGRGSWVEQPDKGGRDGFPDLWHVFRGLRKMPGIQ